MRKNTFCSHFWHFGWHFIQLSIFQLPAVKLLEALSNYANTGKETLSSFIDSSINNVLLQTNPACTSRFLTSHWGARRARAYNGVLSRGRAPGRRVRGAKPLWSWNTFCFWTFNGSRKFAHFFLKFGKAENHSVISDAISHLDFNRILYRYEKRPSNIVEFCNCCWKTAKNAPFHIKSPVKNFYGWAKGGASHRGSLPKYTTGCCVLYLYIMCKKNCKQFI